MKSRLARNYGYGAGRVLLAPDACVRHRRGGTLGASSSALGMAAVALLAIGLIPWIARDQPDRSELRIVAFAEPEPVAEVAPQVEPLPEPQSEPEPEPQPEPRVEIVTQVAVAKPKPEAEPELLVAPVAAPEPVEVARALPEPKALRPAPPRRAAPRIAAVSAPSASPAERAPNARVVVASMRPVASSARPKVSIDAVESEPRPASRPERVPSRPVRPSLSARTSRRGRQPRLDVPAAAAPEAFESSSTPQPRVSRKAPPRRARTHTAPKLAALSAPAFRPPSAATPTPSIAPVARRSTQAPSSTPRSSRPDVRGVALGSLASCVSDREEDALKRAVLAAVDGRDTCQSRAGSWHFVETRNLNAFLMWIERAPHRGVANRCTELELALQCLGASEAKTR